MVNHAGGKQLHSKKKQESDEAKEKKSKSSDIEKALEEEKEKADKYMANWQRTEADLINFKKRSEQDKRDLSESIKSVIVLNLLPVIDDFERAIESIPADQRDAGWVEGIRLIERKMLTYLESLGLCKMEAMGQLFDPNLHEAVCHIEGEEGQVVQEFRTGYKINDRLLRPPMVAVGKGDSEENNKEQED